MIDDVNHLDDGFLVEADICLVGAGVAGLTIARQFLGTSTRLVVVESGGETIDTEIADMNNGEVSGLPYVGLLQGRGRAYGGTSNLWGGQCVPLDPIDFQERSWVAHSGWPINRATLLPYYGLAKQKLWIPADEYENSIWERFGLGSVDFDPALLHVAHTIFISRHNLGQRYKAELHGAANIRILLHAHLMQLDANEYGTQIRQAAIGNLHGKRGRVRAKIFVLCAGAIENARILLLSDSVIPEGLGNHRNNVGRFLQDHPACRCATLETNTPGVLQDHFNLLYGKAARSLRHGWGRKYLPKIALSETVQRKKKTLSCVGQLEYEYDPGSAMQALRDLVVALHMGRPPNRLISSAKTVTIASPLLVRNASRFLFRGLTPTVKPARIYLQAIGEQEPHPDSRVSLSTKRDQLGLRQAHVHWKLRDLDWHTFRVFAETVRDEFTRLGLADVTISDWLCSMDGSSKHVWDSFHQAGTTRMAQSATEGVVDVNCQVFGVDGLYISGGSVFPTSGAVNPVLTVTAMSLRLADHLKEKLAFRPVPSDAIAV